MSRTLSACEKPYSAVEKEATAMIRRYANGGTFLKDPILPIRNPSRSCSRKRTAVKFKMLKFFRSVWNSASFTMASAISPVFITLHLMPYLVRVPLRAVCLSANCTNRSATLVMQDFTTLFGNAICLTPARRRKLCLSFRTCAEIKPPVQSLIKALLPWDRLSLDSKGPVRGECPHLLVAVQ